MKFIHVADMHLGHLFQGVSRVSDNLRKKFYDSTFDVFENIVNFAIKEEVDFILLAGDEFDRHKRSLAEQLFLKKLFEQLQLKNIDVFMIYGNHDYLSTDSVLIDFPDNTHIFSENVTSFITETKNHEKVAISGFSYNKRNINNDFLDEYPVKSANVDFHLGLLHGMVASQSQDYAPFEISELIGKGYDYWALGHIHKREILHDNPYIIYPGDPQGLNRTEVGEKGFYLVESHGSALNAKFISSQKYLWDTVVIDANEGDSIDVIKKKISEKSELLKKNTLFSITINNAQNINEELVKQIESLDFLKYIQDYSQDSKVFPYKVKLKYNNENLLKDLNQEYWDEAGLKIFNENYIYDMDTKLIKNDVLRKHIRDDNISDILRQKTGDVIKRHLSK